VAYFGTAHLGLFLGAVAGFATLVWPPTGIALVALYLYGFSLWPAVFAAALLVNLVHGAPLLVAFAIACGNTLEAVAGAWLLRRMRFQPRLDRVSDVVVLIVAAAIGSTALSAFVGVESLRVGGAALWPVRRGRLGLPRLHHRHRRHRDGLRPVRTSRPCRLAPRPAGVHGHRGGNRAGPRRGHRRAQSRRRRPRRVPLHRLPRAAHAADGALAPCTEPPPSAAAIRSRTES